MLLGIVVNFSNFHWTLNKLFISQVIDISGISLSIFGLNQALIYMFLKSRVYAVPTTHPEILLTLSNLFRNIREAD